MGINTKGMRKVKVNGRPFYWRIHEKDVHIPEEGGFVEPVQERWVHIIDSKKQFIVQYRIPKPRDQDALLVVEGDEFPRQPDADEVRVPRWRHDSKRYPTADFIRRLIGWCLEES